MDSTLKLIQRFQEEGDLEALNTLLTSYLPFIERLIEQYDHSNLGRDVVLEKVCDRFSFIMGKYQLSVQMPIETFLTNTYRLFFKGL